MMRLVAQPELWVPMVAGEPRRRSFPHAPTRLEVLATRAQLSDSELRLLLTCEVQRRLRERGEAWENLDRTLEMRENGH